MKVEKFIDAGSIDPIYYDSSYYVAPDGDAGQDVYAVLRDAIAKAGRIALSRVVIARRERVVALMPMGHGLVAHTLHEARDLNNAKPLFEDVEGVKPDPDMVALATQLIDRQTGRYDPADMDDRYEARLRAVIEAKLKGEGVEAEADEKDSSNVVDLMAALRSSLKQSEETKPAAKKIPAAPPAKKATRKRA